MREKFDVVTRAAFQRQICCDFANRWRELKTVAGKAATQDQIFVFRMIIDHEMPVGG